MNCKRTKEERRCQWNIEREGPPMMELQNKHQKWRPSQRRREWAQKGKDNNKGKTRVNTDKERALGRKSVTNVKRENSPWNRNKANMERKNLPWKKCNEHIKKPTLSQRGAKWAWREWAHRKRAWIEWTWKEKKNATKELQNE
jgi:hypothetical protein